MRVELRLPPEWSRIEAVRQAVGAAILATYGDDELREAVAMTCAELLENAMKYGRPDGEGIALAVVGDDAEVTVSVSHAVDDANHHAEALRARIAWISGFRSAGEAYGAALAEVYERSDVEHVEGGLGLVRIAYEGGCTLWCETPSHGTLRVGARRSVGGGER